MDYIINSNRWLLRTTFRFMWIPLGLTAIGVYGICKAASKASNL